MKQAVLPAVKRKAVPTPGTAMVSLFYSSHMYKFILILAASLSLVAAGAQGVLRGQIADENGQMLPGASVLVVETGQGAAADAEGKYRLSGLAAGRYTIRVAFLGYESVQRSIELKAGEEQTLDVQLAQRGILTGEVIVRATRAGQATPMTYTNLKGEELQRNNLGTDAPILLQWTPSAVVTSDAGAGVGYTGIRIRGTDPTRINVTINGIPLNDAESQGVFWVNLPDIMSSTSDVQIQRGVGASTNGAGAFGATINLNTAKLEPEPYAELSATAGSFNTQRGTLRFGTGLLNDKFTAEGRLSRITSDGYIDRATSDLQSYYLSGAYLGEKSSLRFIAFSGHEVTYQAWYGVPAEFIRDRQLRTFNPAGMEREGEPYENEVDNYRQSHYQLLYNRELHPHWDLNLALHYTRGKGFFEQYKATQHLTDYGLEEVTVGEEVVSSTDLIRRLWLDNHFLGTVYSLNYRSADQRIDFTLGGGLNRYDGLHFGDLVWARFASNSELGARFYENDARKTDFNNFAKLNYALGGGLSAYLDLQYRRVGYNFIGFNRQGENVEDVATFNFFNPKAGLFYQINPQSHAYASVAVANREPNRDDFVDSTSDSRPDPETLYNAEAGYQRNWKRAAFQANVYYMYYRDQLALNGEINDVGAYTRVNVPESYRLGLELAGALELLPGLRFDGNATLSRNKVRAFTEFVDVYDENFDWLGQEAIEHRNTDLSFSPALIAAAGLSYELLRDNPRHGLSVGLQSKYVSRQFIDNTSDPGNTIRPYSYSDLRIGYDWRPGLVRELGLVLLVQNAFDALYEANAWSYRYRFDGAPALDQGFFPQAGRNFLLGLRVRL
jgi:iron complex outermembrane recepter protein